MDILRALISTSLAHGSKLIVGLITLKLIAVYLGPIAMGTLGNFMSVISLTTSFAGGGIISGVIKYVAQYKENPDYLSKFISSSFTYSMFFSLFLLVSGTVFSKPLAKLIFLDGRYWPVVAFLAFVQVFIALNNLIIGVINGLGETAIYAYIVIIGNILAVPVMFSLIKFGGEYGAMVSLVISPALMSVPALYVAIKSRFKENIRLKFNTDFSRKLSVYSLMVFASATILPISEILIRNQIMSNLGLVQAGMWQSLSRIGLAYVSFFTLFLSYYYMPKLSGSKNKIETVGHVKRFFKLVLIGVFVVSVVVFVFRVYFIKMILSDQFLTISDYIIYQLIGDALKIMGYVFGFLTVAKTATKLYLAAELIQGVGYVLLASVAIRLNYGLTGVMLSYVTISAVYLFTSFIAFFIYYKKTEIN